VLHQPLFLMGNSRYQSYHHTTVESGDPYSPVCASDHLFGVVQAIEINILHGVSVGIVLKFNTQFLNQVGAIVVKQHLTCDD